MSFSNFYKYDSISRKSTQEDSSSEGEYDSCYSKTNPAKHKTELCKTFSELGYCPYENKCRFAHGKHQLIKVRPNFTMKNRKCNGYWKNGCCSYGIRCQFGHAEVKWQTSAALLCLQAMCEPKCQKNSKLLKRLV